MRILPTADGLVVETDAYRAQMCGGDRPTVLVWRELTPMLTLPAMSGLASVERGETLTTAAVAALRGKPLADGGVAVTLHAESDLWGARAFHWAFHEDHIEPVGDRAA